MDQIPCSLPCWEWDFSFGSFSGISQLHQQSSGKKNKRPCSLVGSEYPDFFSTWESLIFLFLNRSINWTIQPFLALLVTISPSKAHQFRLSVLSQVGVWRVLYSEIDSTQMRSRPCKFWSGHIRMALLVLLRRLLNGFPKSGLPSCSTMYLLQKPVLQFFFVKFVSSNLNRTWTEPPEPVQEVQFEFRFEFKLFK